MNTLALGYLVFLVSAASPGPSTMAIAATSLAHGRAAGIRFATGVVCGSVFWGLLAAAGVGSLLVTAGWALTGLKLAGGCYLLWMAWKAARSAMRAGDAPPAPPGGRFLARGLALHLTNAKAVFGWASIVAVGLPPEATLAHVAMLLAGCAAMAVAVNLGYALLFSTAPLVAAYARARRWIEGAMAIVFGAAGIGMLAWRGP